MPPTIAGRSARSGTESPERFRHTKIVCTIGPATEDASMIERLVAAGMDVARLNAAHGSPDEHAGRIRRIREAAGAVAKPLAILLDLPGPKLRVEVAGRVEGGSCELLRGEQVVVGDRQAESSTLRVDVPDLARQIAPGQRISLSDGAVRLEVREVEPPRILCEVVMGGVVRSGSGANLPDTDLALTVPTDEDRRWLAFAGDHDVDWVGVSFVRSADELAEVRASLQGAEAPPLVMAKIEKRETMERLEEVVAAADAVMVARGDLGVETPLAEVPLAQKRIIATANEKARPVVTATQMLESMVDEPSPTRAEVTDVANAVLDGTDAVMLSAETAIGQYPVEATEVLRDVIIATETRYAYGAALDRVGQRPHGSVQAAVAAQACRMAGDLDARALALAATGLAAVAAVARYRPRARVIAVSKPRKLLRQLSLVWGIMPLAVDAPERSPAFDLMKDLAETGGHEVLVVLPESAFESASELEVERLQGVRVVVDSG